jgi:hypothetical protein
MSNIHWGLVSEDDSRIFTYRNDFLVSDNMLPVRKHQAMEELINIEKEFAAVIYAQRYLDKYPVVYYNGRKKEKKG